MQYLYHKCTTRLNTFARSWFYNATAVRGALWWLRQNHSVNYANHQHSPDGATSIFQFLAPKKLFVGPSPHFVTNLRRWKLHFPRYCLVKVSWKSVPFPRTVVSYFVANGKKNRKNGKKTKKTSVKHIRIRLIGDVGVRGAWSWKLFVHFLCKKVAKS